MAGLLFAGGLAAGLGAGMTAIAHVFGPDGGPPVTGARLVQERCDQHQDHKRERGPGEGADRARLRLAGSQGGAHGEGQEKAGVELTKKWRQCPRPGAGDGQPAAPSTGRR